MELIFNEIKQYGRSSDTHGSIDHERTVSEEFSEVFSRLEEKNAPSRGGETNDMAAATPTLSPTETRPDTSGPSRKAPSTKVVSESEATMAQPLFEKAVASGGSQTIRIDKRVIKKTMSVLGMAGPTHRGMSQLAVGQGGTADAKVAALSGLGLTLKTPATRRSLVDGNPADGPLIQPEKTSPKGRSRALPDAPSNASKEHDHVPSPFAPSRNKGAHGHQVDTGRGMGTGPFSVESPASLWRPEVKSPGITADKEPTPLNTRGESKLPIIGATSRLRKGTSESPMVLKVDHELSFQKTNQVTVSARKPTPSDEAKGLVDLQRTQLERSLWATLFRRSPASQGLTEGNPASNTSTASAWQTLSANSGFSSGRTPPTSSSTPPTLSPTESTATRDFPFITDLSHANSEGPANSSDDRTFVDPVNAGVRRVVHRRSDLAGHGGTTSQTTGETNRSQNPAAAAARESASDMASMPLAKAGEKGLLAKAKGLGIKPIVVRPKGQSNAHASHAEPGSQTAAKANLHAAPATSAPAVKESPFMPLSKLPPQTIRQLNQTLQQAIVVRPRAVTLRLEPESLGQVQVRVSLDADQIHARIMTESSRVSAMIRGAQHDLEYALRQQGMELADLDVREEGSDQPFQGFQRDATPHGDHQTPGFTGFQEMEFMPTLDELNAIPTLQLHPDQPLNLLA